MGSSANSRYWVCPHCFRQFDWEREPDKIGAHPKTCRARPDVRLRQGGGKRGKSSNQTD